MSSTAAPQVSAEDKAAYLINLLRTESTDTKNLELRDAFVSHLVPDEEIIRWLRSGEASIYHLHTITSRPVPFSRELSDELFFPKSKRRTPDIILQDLAARIDITPEAARAMVLNEDGSLRVSRTGAGQKTKTSVFPPALTALQNESTPLSVVRAVYEAEEFPGEPDIVHPTTPAFPYRGGRQAEQEKIRDEMKRSCLDHPRFPLPLLAALVNEEGSFSNVAEAVLFGKRRTEAQALVAEQEPDLAGLPDRLLVEVLALMALPAEWDEPLPEHPAVNS